nr:MAG TPA: hypothetical protein [Caudoviricetes sp.]
MFAERSISISQSSLISWFQRHRRKVHTLPDTSW